jgi:hypothetical protein
LADLDDGEGDVCRCKEFVTIRGEDEEPPEFCPRCGKPHPANVLVVIEEIVETREQALEAMRRAGQL